MRIGTFARILVCGSIALALCGWSRGGGGGSGPFTVDTPFTISLASGYNAVGATVTMTASGKYRTITGTVCNLSPTPFSVTPATSNFINQWLVGNDSCAIRVFPFASEPPNAIAQLFYPAIQPSTTVTLALGDGVTTNFASLGGSASPGGGLYGIVPLYPKNGTVTLTAGGVVGTDAGTLLSNGKMNITGSGITSATIVVLQSSSYSDGNLATHSGYYDITFAVPPGNGVPITLTLQFGWAPAARQVATPNFDGNATYSMVRLLPSADDSAARAVALAISNRTLVGSGIPILDPNQAYGIPLGQALAPPCLDMTLDCAHTGPNTNYPAVQAACPENTVGNTYQWTASTKRLRFTTSGTSGNPKIYCGFDLSLSTGGWINDTNSPSNWLVIKYNKVNYNTGISNTIGIRIDGQNTIVEHNEVYLDTSSTTVMFGGAISCAAWPNSSGAQAGNKFRYNWFRDCGSDGIDASSVNGWEITSNLIEVNGGLTAGQHADGWQSTGNNTTITNGLISKNYITNYSLNHAQTYLNFISGPHIQSKNINGVVFYSLFGLSPTTAFITTTGNFLDGGTFNQVFSSGAGIHDIALTNNYFGTNNTYLPTPGAFSPSPQTGNMNASSGASYNPW